MDKEGNLMAVLEVDKMEGVDRKGVENIKSTLGKRLLEDNFVIYKLPEGGGGIPVTSKAAFEALRPTPLPEVKVEWESGWPEGVKASISDIFFADSQGRVILASGYGNIWRSEDGGNSWVNVARLNCQTPLARDPHNPQIMYVGTRNDATVYKSLDGGKSWKPTSTTGLSRDAEDLFQGVQGLAVDATGRIWTSLQSGLYISEDGGETWSKPTSVPAPAQWQWKHVKETRPDGQAYYDTYESRDGGQTWTKRKEGASSWRRLYIYGLFTDVERRLHISVDTPIREKYQFRTSDGGRTWEESYPEVPNPRRPPKKDPNNSNIVFKQRELPDYPQGLRTRFLLSFDSGRTWSEVKVPDEAKRGIPEFVYELISSQNTLKLFLEGAKGVLQASIPLNERGLPE